MSREAQRVHRGMVDTDRTSNSPEQVLDLILSYLPLREIVRTSILSTNWRYNWATVPRLVFDMNCCSALWKTTAIDDIRALAGIIDRVLLLHTGSIEALKIKGICAIPDIDRWVLHVSRRPIKKLVLRLYSAEQYRLHSSFYSCERLVTLKLSDCFLSPPSSFKGFKCLKRLRLLFCSFEEDAFANLISSCPLLEDLLLYDLKGLRDLEIDAPNLQRVDIAGRFDKVNFGRSMAKLSNVVMDKDDDTNIEGLFPCTESGLIKFFTNLPNIQRLEMRQCFLSHLAAGLIPVNMPFHLKELYHLTISMDFKDLNQILAALCLINSSPNLTELEIQSWLDYGLEPYTPSISRGGAERRCKFEKLRRVKLVCFDGRRSELELMKFVLANSPVLEKMTLTCSCDYEHLTPEEVLRFERLSPRAEIIIDLGD